MSHPSPPHRPRVSRRSRFTVLVAALVVLAGCQWPRPSQEAAIVTVDPRALPESDEVTVRLGYFPNVTHAPALVGLERGFFQREMNALGGSLEALVFNAGPDAVETLLSGGLDMTYIGPNPAVNAFARSGGEAVRVVAGSATGGARLIVRQDIDEADDLRGQEVASPQLGGTQDVALRHWLAEQGLETDRVGGGDVSVVPQSNGDSFTAFRSGQIAGAWVPAPWDTRLIEEVGGKVLVDGADLWPQGRFATTILVVRTEFLAEHPAAVSAVLRAHLSSLAMIEADPEGSQDAANSAIDAATGHRLSDALMLQAWAGLAFGPDPVVSSVLESAQHAVELGLGRAVDLSPLFDLRLLDHLLRKEGGSTVLGS